MDDHLLEHLESLRAKASAAWFGAAPQKACTIYGQAVAALPGDAPPHVVVTLKSEYALALRATGAYPAALALYEELAAYCEAVAYDATNVLRGWAIACEGVRDFARARALYDQITPAVDAPRDERFTWEHAVAVLNWSEGRLSDAARHFARATEALPDDPAKAAEALPALGNDALLSLILGDSARAYRLADQMQEIRAGVAAVPLDGDVSLVKIRAALARHRGDFAAEATLLRRAIEDLAREQPDDLLPRLSLAAAYGEAALRAGETAEAKALLAKLAAAAPADLAVYAYVALVPLQLADGEAEAARESLGCVIVAICGKGSPESEQELIAPLAELADLSQNPDAAVFLGKLALKYLALLARNADVRALQSVLAASDRMLLRIVSLLRGFGRFGEAVVFEALYDRLRRQTYLSGARPTQAVDPVPLTPSERVAEQCWHEDRATCVALRAAGDPSALARHAGASLERLIGFRTPPAETSTPVPLAPPPPGRLSLALVPGAESCEVVYRWHDGSLTIRIGVTPEQLHHEIAALREGVSDAQAWRAPATRLYRWLLAPIEEKLAQIDRLEIEAAGALGHVPFALLTENDVLLGERVAIAFVLPGPGPDPQRRSASGLVHLSSYAAGPLSHMPLATGETPAPFAPVRALFGADFGREALDGALATRPAYLSVATHLDIEPGRPDVTHLWLGAEEPLYLAEFALPQFDLSATRVALFATCSSALADPSSARDTSLAALVLDKGAGCFVGTLWDISESAAAAFVPAFWKALGRDPTRDPAQALAAVLAEHAQRLRAQERPTQRTGGIGAPPPVAPPDDWAGFAIFEHRDVAQPLLPAASAPSDS